MIIQNQKINPTHPLVWQSLAFQAGVLNIGGFLACHRFVTHTTGFATHFGADLAQFKLNEAFNMLLVPLFFLAGTITAAYYVEYAKHKHQKPNYSFLFFLMSFFLGIIVILGSTGALGLFGTQLELNSEFTLLAFLCLTSGIQNATLSSASKNLLRTTHLTGVTTDLGIGLVRQFLLHNKHESNLNKTRTLIIFSFVIGSAIGAFAFIHFQYLGFILPFLITLILFIFSRHKDFHD